MKKLETRSASRPDIMRSCAQRFAGLGDGQWLDVPALPMEHSRSPCPEGNLSGRKMRWAPSVRGRGSVALRQGRASAGHSEIHFMVEPLSRHGGWGWTRQNGIV